MKLIKDTIFYGIIQSLNKAIPFFILPLIISLYGKESYGEYVYVLTLEAIVLPITTLCLEKAFNRQFFENINIQAYLSSITIIVILSFIALEAILFIISNNIYNVKYLQYGVLSALAMYFLQIQILYSRNKEKKLLYAFTLISSTIVMVMIILLNPKKDVHSLVTARVVGLLFPSIVITFNAFINQEIKVTFVKDYFIKAFSFSSPIILSSLLSISFISMDKIFVKNVLGSAEMGIYSVHFQLSSLLSVLLSAFNTAYIPFYFQNWNTNNKKIIKYKYISYLTMPIMALIIYIFNYTYIYMFISEMDVNVIVLVFLTLSYLFQGYYFIEVVHIYHINKTKYLIYPPLASNIISLVLYYEYIDEFSISIASFISLVSWIALYVSTMIIKIIYKK